jgi:2-oxoisovalerate dehydrogenase E1 component
MNTQLAAFAGRSTGTHLERAYLIRVVEERLLQLFAAGKLSGTTHTCIGQELAAIALSDALDDARDIIFSNHRCHGHYIAWTDDVEGLIAEVMGKATGPCGGIGGSQHLCGRGFFSNGVQGGIAPVAAGIALAQKRGLQRGITTVCIGDGTLGEGVLYETLNIAMRWGLPLLIVLENNGYAQSTAQTETLAGDICARAAAFGIPTMHANTWKFEELATTLRRAADRVRAKSIPTFVRIDTYRLAAHSKGDDDRDRAELDRYSAEDPVNGFLADVGDSGETAERCAAARARVERAVELAEAAASPKPPGPPTGRSLTRVELEAVTLGSDTQLAAINRALHEWLAEDERAIALGEDIRSPYGGAFKVTRGLSDAFPDRVINCPISEAAIVGIGTGLALKGFRPIVEIMFGDFLTLCFDQLVNHAAKFAEMYNDRVNTPLLVRTPMGGGRGYGPTHSQNLEKHVVGIPGLTTIVLHGRARIDRLFRALRASLHPVLMIENKLLYKERADRALPTGYVARETLDNFPTTVLSPTAEPDLSIVAFGRMGLLAEQVLEDLARTEEIMAELILPLRVWPFDAAPIVQSVSRTHKLLVIEEGASGFDLGAEVIAAVAVAGQGRIAFASRRIAARPVAIPSSPYLEPSVLPQLIDIRQACLELFDG